MKFQVKPKFCWFSRHNIFNININYYLFLYHYKHSTRDDNNIDKRYIDNEKMIYFICG